MFDATSEQTGDADTFDVCIVGAGAAGLNALFSASKHLAPGSRVALIERRAEAGGMWTETYDFVRLHQPHPMFTAGNIPWTINQPPHYLAKRDEVAAHLRHCLTVLSGGLKMTMLFGHSFDGAEEDAGGVTVRYSAADGGAADVLRAKRLIVASGYDVPVLQPLAFTSDAVVSTSPAGLSSLTMSDETPVYVVGAGKTGMDTCHELLTRNPSRKVTLIAGSGIAFARRELFAPVGKTRWFGGQLSTNIFKMQSMAFDGRNAHAVIDRYGDQLTRSLKGSAPHFLFGVMSEEEMALVRDGLSEVRFEYCEDVVDGAAGPEMVMRSGARLPLEPGAVVMNCTSHIAREDLGEALPYVSDGGAILRISPRGSVHFLSTVSAYFLTDLWYRGQLPMPGLYVADMAELLKLDRVTLRMVMVTLSFMMQCVMVKNLPFSVLDSCGLDLNRWFPLYRRAIMLVDLKVNGNKYIDHCKTCLDRVAEDNGVVLAPLVHRSAESAAARSMAPS